MNDPVAVDRQLVVVLKAAAGESGRPGTDDARLVQRLQPFSKASFVPERLAIERAGCPLKQNGSRRRPTE